MGMRQRRGFSLIELLVVIFILGVGLASISALFVSGIVSSRKAQRISTANNMARQQMERLRSGGFSACVADDWAFPSARGYTVVTGNADGTGQVTFPVPQLPSGAGTIDIAYYDSGVGIYPNLKDITITIDWAGGTPMEGTIVLRNFLANHP